MLKKLLFILVLLQSAFVTSVISDEIKTEIGDFKQNNVIHVTAADALQLVEENSELIVLDVRTPIEYKRGHIKGAININYYSFSFKEKIAALDRDKTYLVHCATGVRSGRSLPIMLEAGFNNLLHMDGGFKLWKQSGHPIIK